MPPPTKKAPLAALVGLAPYGPEFIGSFLQVYRSDQYTLLLSPSSCPSRISVSIIVPVTLAHAGHVFGLRVLQRALFHQSEEHEYCRLAFDCAAGFCTAPEVSIKDNAFTVTLHMLDRGPDTANVLAEILPSVLTHLFFPGDLPDLTDEQILDLVAEYESLAEVAAMKDSLLPEYRRPTGFDLIRAPDDAFLQGRLKKLAMQAHRNCLASARFYVLVSAGAPAAPRLPGSLSGPRRLQAAATQQPSGSSTHTGGRFQQVFQASGGRQRAEESDSNSATLLVQAAARDALAAWASPGQVGGIGPRRVRLRVGMELTFEPAVYSEVQALVVFNASRGVRLKGAKAGSGPRADASRHLSTTAPSGSADAPEPQVPGTPEPAIPVAELPAPRPAMFDLPGPRAETPVCDVSICTLMLGLPDLYTIDVLDALV